MSKNHSWAGAFKRCALGVTAAGLSLAASTASA